MRIQDHWACPNYMVHQSTLYNPIIVGGKLALDVVNLGYSHCLQLGIYRNSGPFQARGRRE